MGSVGSFSFGFRQISVYDWKENEIPDRYVRIVETQYAVVMEDSTSVRLIFVFFCSHNC